MGFQFYNFNYDKYWKIYCKVKVFLKIINDFKSEAQYGKEE